MVRWGVLAWVPGVILLTLSVLAFAFAPGFAIINFFFALPLAIASGVLVLAISRLVSTNMSEPRLSRTRISVAATLFGAWILAWLLSPLLIIVSGPVVLLALMSLPGVSTSASLTPEFHLYGSLLVSAAPFAGIGLLSALVLLVPAVRLAPLATKTSP